MRAPPSPKLPLSKTARLSARPQLSGFLFLRVCQLRKRNDARRNSYDHTLSQGIRKRLKLSEEVHWQVAGEAIEGLYTSA